jgi:hypothetical protein
LAPTCYQVGEHRSCGPVWLTWVRFSVMSIESRRGDSNLWPAHYERAVQLLIYREGQAHARVRSQVQPPAFFKALEGRAGTLSLRGSAVVGRLASRGSQVPAPQRLPQIPKPGIEYYSDAIQPKVGTHHQQKSLRVKPMPERGTLAQRSLRRPDKRRRPPCTPSCAPRWR